MTFGDIGLMIIRISRPLPGPFPHHVNESLGHRHLDLLVGGLVGVGARQLGGPSLSLDDLRTMSSEQTDEDALAEPPAN